MNTMPFSVKLSTPNSRIGVNLILPVRATPPYKNPGSLGGRSPASLLTHLLLLSPNRRPKQFHPLTRSFISSVATAHHYVCHQGRSCTCPTMSRHTTLLTLCFRHFLYYCPLNLPEFHPSPTSLCCHWELVGSSFPTQLWESWI